ncbi:hypothetical protein CBR_g30344 [Chara braunii]|uniref:Uncharacterized protein n=1 Tax=Chara braunii TaxID=69332 RepID=A0A388JX52_CHABU|nr:hypothetical protein CBR_g30344 [Chara braunii]|eukprot:GBG62391.1 hypothetical protein CBR_g30344 [Chara braunii]
MTMEGYTRYKSRLKFGSKRRAMSLQEVSDMILKGLPAFQSLAPGCHSLRVLTDCKCEGGPRLCGVCHPAAQDDEHDDEMEKVGDESRSLDEKYNLAFGGKIRNSPRVRYVLQGGMAMRVRQAALQSKTLTSRSVSPQPSSQNCHKLSKTCLACGALVHYADDPGTGLLQFYRGGYGLQVTSSLNPVQEKLDTENKQQPETTDNKAIQLPLGGRQPVLVGRWRASHFMHRKAISAPDTPLTKLDVSASTLSRKLNWQSMLPSYPSRDNLTETRENTTGNLRIIGCVESQDVVMTPMPCDEEDSRGAKPVSPLVSTESSWQAPQKQLSREMETEKDSPEQHSMWKANEDSLGAKPASPLVSTDSSRQGPPKHLAREMELEKEAPEQHSMRKANEDSVAAKPVSPLVSTESNCQASPRKQLSREMELEKDVPEQHSMWKANEDSVAGKPMSPLVSTESSRQGPLKQLSREMELEKDVPEQHGMWKANEDSLGAKPASPLVSTDSSCQAPLKQLSREMELEKDVPEQHSMRKANEGSLAAKPASPLISAKQLSREMELEKDSPEQHSMWKAKEDSLAAEPAFPLVSADSSCQAPPKRLAHEMELEKDAPEQHSMWKALKSLALKITGAAHEIKQSKTSSTGILMPQLKRSGRSEASGNRQSDGTKRDHTSRIHQGMNMKKTTDSGTNEYMTSSVTFSKSQAGTYVTADSTKNSDPTRKNIGISRSFTLGVHVNSPPIECHKLARTRNKVFKESQIFKDMFTSYWPWAGNPDGSLELYIIWKNHD